MQPTYLLLLCLLFSLSLQQCMDASNTPQDYLVMLKYPSTSQLSSYFSIFTSTEQKLLAQSYPIDHNGGALANTFKTAKGGKIIAWNDDAPVDMGTSGAHSKGVIYYNEKTDTGFYLVHSCPKYPQIENNVISHVLDPNQNIYGQSYLCMTINGQTLDKIAYGLNIIKANIYYNTISDVPLANLHDFSNNVKFARHNYNNTESVMYQLGNTHVASVFKNYKYEVDYFQAILGPALGSTLIVESWGRPYVATSNKVINNLNVNIGGISFANTQDHSKWAYSYEKDLVCIGDLNNMASQNKRGGGFHCLLNANLKKEFLKISSQ